MTLCIEKLDEAALEQSSYVVSASFYDENGDAVTPDSVTWTLTDLEGAVINSREDVSITPASSVSIVLQGDDLQITGTTLPEWREFAIEAVYTSATHGSMNLNEGVRFKVCPLVGV